MILVRAATFNGKYCFACNCIGNSSTSCCDTIDAQLLLETLGQDYIRTARAKGLSEFQIIRKHALKNSLNRGNCSGWFASMLAGVFVEFIFGWNGLGKEIVEALNNLDLPVIMGSVLVISTTFVVINILVDIIYAYLDPKIRLT
jgi:peptide/nickel transport system permease protein